MTGPKPQASLGRRLTILWLWSRRSRDDVRALAYYTALRSGVTLR